MLLDVDLARLGCTSQAIGIYIYRQTRYSALARRLPIKLLRPPLVRRTLSSWVRREILLLRWRTPYGASVPSILPALPDAYLAISRCTEHHSQDTGLTDNAYTR